MNENFMLTQTDVLARGWTKNMIGKLLPEPTLGKNKYCRYHPVKLWDIKVVEKAEETEKYQKAIEKVQSHREGGYKAASTRREATQKDFEAEKASIHIPLVDDETLRTWVYQDRRAYNLSKGWFELYPEDAPEETMQRWIVNFIRHNLAEYDYTLSRNKGRFGIHDCYEDYKNTVLNKIAEVYPQYADECRRQMV